MFMGKKRKRTGKTYYDKDRDVFVIDKARKDMNCTELKLLEMGGYTNIVPDPNRDKNDELDITEWQRKIDKKQAKLEKRNEKMIEEFWEEYFDYLKHPKKYKGKMSKTEKKILKFFNKRAKKDKKNNKEDKELKKAMKNPLDYCIYMKLKQHEEEVNNLLMERTGRTLYSNSGKKSKSFKNPNKSFFARNGTEEYDETKTVLLKTIEEELLERLNDESMFDRDNIVVEYGEVDLDKKKKKKKKKDVDRLII